MTTPTFLTEHIANENSWQTKLDFIALPKFLRTGWNQNLILGVIFLCCPGFFNALQGLGAAGGSDTTTVAAMNMTLYLTFFLFGTFGGFFFHFLGNKLLLFVGGSTYALYSICVYLWGQNPSLGSLAVVASALLGIGAGVFWTTQGAMTMSYATSDKKGEFIASFWVLFNLGGVIGGFITFFMNKDGDQTGQINALTYYVFCGIMFFGAVASLFLIVHPSKVTKADERPVSFRIATSPMEEFRGTIRLFTNKQMILLTPFIISSNWFYTYEFNGINFILFDSATRGLNSGFYWLMQMIGSWVVGKFILDKISLGTRQQRGKIGVILVVLITAGQWIYAVPYQLNSPYDRTPANPPISYKDNNAEFWTPFILFMYMGFVDAAQQTLAYWLIGALSNDADVLASYAGYYKGVQSLGVLVAWTIEFKEVSYIIQMWICVALFLLYPVPMYYLACEVEDEIEQNPTSLSETISDARMVDKNQFGRDVPNEDFPNDNEQLTIAMV